MSGNYVLLVKRISKNDTRSLATAYRWPAVLMSLPFIGLGTFFALGGFGFTPLPGKANAPLWVIGFVGVAFASAGLVLLVHGLRGVINQWRIAERREAGRIQPWFVDHPWDHRGVSDRPFGRMVGSIFFPLSLAVFLTPFNWWAFGSDQGGWFVIAIVGIFDLMLVFVTGSAVYRVAQTLRYGGSRLAFRRFPFHPGGKLQVALSGRRLERLDATLRFVEERFEQRGSGSNRSTTHVSYEHYNEKKQLQWPGHAPQVEISFEIPNVDDWVTELSGQPVRYWELLVESEQPGIDYRTTFPLPIYPRN